MDAYLRWAAWQFYLLLFWPTRFEREVEGFWGRVGPRVTLQGRLRYMARMLPYSLGLAGGCACATGVLCQAAGVPFSWQRVAFGVGLGVGCGGAFGVAGSVRFGVAFGLGAGIGAGIAAGIGVDVGAGAGFSVGFGVGGGVGLAIALGIESGVAFSVATAVACAVAFGVLGSFRGIAAGIAFGTAFPVSFLFFRHRLLGYLVNAPLGWLAWRRATREKDAAFKCWRWHPVRWNEVIWLPVPKLAEFLALLIRQDREEGFKALAFVAAERRLQRRAIPRALTEVALDDLAADSLPAIAAAPERLAWRRGSGLAELPGELGLDRCERVAEHVAQSLVVQDAYRRRIALDEATKELMHARKALALSSSRYAFRVLQILNGWAALLEAEVTRLAAEPATRRQLPQPFAFGNPLREEQAHIFASRTDVLAELERAFLDTAARPALLLHGPRRMGKSSLLRQLPRLLGPDFAPAYLDLQQPGCTDSAPRLLHAMAKAICEGLRARRVEAIPPRLEHLSVDSFGRLSDWLEELERALPADLRIVLALDEYEKLQERAVAGADWVGHALDLTRHWMQHHPRLALLFTGMHAFADLGPAWTSRFVSVRKVRVSFLAREALIPILTRPVPEFDLVWEPGAMDELLDATGSQPFLTQAVAFELVQHLNEQECKQASPAAVTTACTRALESGAAYFENVWDDIGEDGRALVAAVLRGDTPAAQSAAARVRVQEQEVLDSTMCFKVPLVQRWMRARIDRDRGGT